MLPSNVVFTSDGASLPSLSHTFVSHQRIFFPNCFKVKMTELRQVLLLLSLLPNFCQGDLLRKRLNFDHQLGSPYTENNSVKIALDKGKYVGSEITPGLVEILVSLLHKYLYIY